MEDSSTNPGAHASSDLVGPAARTLRAYNQVAALQYVTVTNAPTYRAIVEVFFAARHHYVIELRPAEILQRIRDAGLFVELSSDQDLEYHLEQLVRWGNLAAAHDAGSVARLEDFYRKRLLYRLTATGDAAHRAVLDVEATTGKSGSLQSNMLARIRDTLADIAVAPWEDPKRFAVLLHDLHAAFETLTAEANRFIGDLDRSVMADHMEEDRFILYKQALLAYISRFVEQLRRLADEIRSAIKAVEDRGIDAILEAASGAADLPPARGEDDDPVIRWRADERARWAGIRSWFLGGVTVRAGAAAHPTVERLAEVARDAVVALTRALERLNDRRVHAVDRKADFRTLARWFAACPDARDAHELWQVAFGLASARHFHMAEEDAERTPSIVSWWDAPPVEVPVRLRTRGGTSAAGRPAAIIDHSTTREWIAQKRRHERAQFESALYRFAHAGSLHLRDLVSLDAAEFDLFLSLLDQALCAPRDVDGLRSARSADGRLQVTLHPVHAAAAEPALVETPDGWLRIPDYRLDVRDLLQGERDPYDVPGAVHAVGGSA